MLNHVLKKIMLTRTQDAILRSKVRWHEEEECNTKGFYSLGKPHHEIKTVPKLKVRENSYIEDQFEVLKKTFMSRYYTVPLIQIPKISKINPFSMKKM